jgi:hypothetical protein
MFCSNFLTTRAHAPRLRRRWAREIERHQGIQRRLERLLVDIDEPLDGPHDGC